MSEDASEVDDDARQISAERLNAMMAKWTEIPDDTPVTLTKQDMDTIITCLKLSQLGTVYAANAAVFAATGAARKENDKRNLKKAVHDVLDRANLLMERLANRLERGEKHGQ